MKRVFLFVLICLLALTGVFANEATVFETVSSEQSFEQPFDNAAQLEVLAVSSQTELNTCPCPDCQKTKITGIGIYLNPSGIGFGGLQTDGKQSLIGVNEYLSL